MGKHDTHPTPPLSQGVTVHVTDSGGLGLIEATVNILSQTSADDYVAISNVLGDAYIPNVSTRVTNIILTVEKEGYIKYSGTYAMSIFDTYFPIQLDKIVPIQEPWNTLTSSQVRAFNGNFCGLYLKGIPYQSNSIIYTPAYMVYDATWRKKIRDAYKEEGLIHFPVVIHNGPIYNSTVSTYPNLNISTERRDELLKELYNDGLIPVVTTIDQKATDVNPNFPADLIRVAFVKWEQNDGDADNNNTLLMASNIIKSRRAIRPDCLLYVHFTPEHSSGVGEIPMWYNPDDATQISAVERSGWIGIIPNQDDSNGQWWKWAKKVGVEGILLQAEPEDNLQDTRKLISDFTDRFGRGTNGWPTGMFVQVFEVKAHKVFYNDITQAQNKQFNNDLRNYIYIGIQPSGYCNG